MAIKGPALRQGDAIGVVTLGSPVSRAIIDARIRDLQAMGFQVVIGRYIYEENGFLSGTDEERAAV